MRKTVKQVTLAACKKVGLFSAVRDGRWRSRRLLILCYHGISLDDEHEWCPQLYMSPSEFRARMELLRRDAYRVLPLDAALRLLHEDRLPPRSVAITFDDGFHDFFKHAHPILREFGYPATVYLATYYSGYNRPVFDVICPYLLWKGRGRILDTAGIVKGGTRVDLCTPASREAAWSEIERYALHNRFSAEEKNQLAAKLAARVHVDYAAILAKRILHLMTAQEVALVQKLGVDMQLHTHRHRTPLDRTLFLNEIADNRRDIVAMTRVTSPPSHFCYPSGVYRPDFLPWLTEAGVTSAVTCDLGMASSTSASLLLPRFLDSNSLSLVEFEAWLTGVAALLPRSDGSHQLSEIHAT